MNMRNLLYLLLMITLFEPTIVMAQTKLVLENDAKFKRIEISPGTKLGIKPKGMDVMFFGELERTNAEYIYIFGDSIRPDSIARIHVEQAHYWPGMVRGAAVMSMLIYPVMILINNPPRTWNATTALQIGSIWAGAMSINLLMKRLYFKRYPLQKGNWQLRLMERLYN